MAAPAHSFTMVNSNTNASTITARNEVAQQDDALQQLLLNMQQQSALLGQFLASRGPSPPVAQAVLAPVPPAAVPAPAPAAGSSPTPAELSDGPLTDEPLAKRVKYTIKKLPAVKETKDDKKLPAVEETKDDEPSIDAPLPREAEQAPEVRKVTYASMLSRLSRKRSQDACDVVKDLVMMVKNLSRRVKEVESAIKDVQSIVDASSSANVVKNIGEIEALAFAALRRTPR